MGLLVQKFGGTSMGSPARIHHVADIIIRTLQEGHQVIVVVSAMGHETDRLVDLAGAFEGRCDSREYAALLSSGEQVSAALLAMCLTQKGYKACSMTGWQVGILTDSHHEKASIEHIDEAPLQKRLSAGYIPIVTGFQGIDEHGDITLLGRGGSDTTAVALAARFSAQECQIYTDVDGVYTADPHIEPKARLLKTITTEEMLELSGLGNKVLQVRSVELAHKYHVPLRVLSSFKESDNAGTHIVQTLKTVREKPLISGITYCRQEAIISLDHVALNHMAMTKILAIMNTHAIDVDIVIQHHTLTLALSGQHYEQAMVQLDAFKPQGDNTLSRLSLVGIGLRHHGQILQNMLQTLALEAINVVLVATSEINISIMIQEKHLEKGLCALHAALRLDELPQEEV